MKHLDRKLDAIRSGRYTPAYFILADAKDADMAMGLTSPARVRDVAGGLGAGHTDRAAYLDAMRQMVREGDIDILLASASSAERLAGEGLFTGSAVTPAVRYNDATDIWFARGARYTEAPSRPFRSARLPQVRAFADLGLYSVTFSNEVEADLRTLDAYAAFREEAAALGLRHFLEVFNPAFDIGLGEAAAQAAPADLGAFIGDSIVRTLAGVVAAEQPVFLKIAYNGYAAMRELARYDPQHLIVGILGGARGTTRDTFELLARAEAAGARAALFGRKIKDAEDPLRLVGLMRAVLARALAPDEAVRVYHEGLREAGRVPDRALGDDLELTDPVLLSE
ncbi:MAG: hypothetical protein RLZZ373_1561 [Pseudomonadota bacterium]|jgi:hypothetical protein